MRLAPVAVRHWQDPAVLVDVARRQSITTHGASQAVEVCERFARVLAEAIAGRDWQAALDGQEDSQDLAIAAIIAGDWRAKSRSQILSSGYVIHSF